MYRTKKQYVNMKKTVPKIGLISCSACVSKTILFAYTVSLNCEDLYESGKLLTNCLVG